MPLRGEGAEDNQEIGQPDQHDVPDLQDAALFLDDDAVQEGGARQPGQKAGVFHRVPCPIASPTQLHIRPLAAHEDAGGKKHPRDQRPAAHGAHPFVVETLAEQRSDGESEGHGHADVAQIEHDRMQNHPEVLQKRIQALPIRRDKAGAFEGIAAKTSNTKKNNDVVNNVALT